MLSAATDKITGGHPSTSYSDPFTVARQFASLDHLSHGRAGWNVVTSPLEGSAKTSRTEHPNTACVTALPANSRRRQRAVGLEDDAFVRNKTSGEFFRTGKLHTQSLWEFFSAQAAATSAARRRGA